MSIKYYYRKSFVHTKMEIMKIIGYIDHVWIFLCDVWFCLLVLINVLLWHELIIFFWNIAIFTDRNYDVCKVGFFMKAFYYILSVNGQWLLLINGGVNDFFFCDFIVNESRNCTWKAVFTNNWYGMWNLDIESFFFEYREVFGIFYLKKNQNEWNVQIGWPDRAEPSWDNWRWPMYTRYCLDDQW
jgi:hypothetical protein